MNIQSTADLIASLKCELRETNLFTEDELNSLDFCVPQNTPLLPEDVTIPSIPTIPDLLPCLDQLNSVISTAAANLNETIKIQTVKAKVQEIIDNLSVVQQYYDARYQTFNTYAIDSTVLLVQLTNLTDSLKSSTVQSVKISLQSKINAINSQINDLKKKDSVLSDPKFDAKTFLTKDTFVSSLISTISQYCTNSLVPSIFSPILVNEDKNQQFSFRLNIPQLRAYSYKDSSGNAQTINIIDYLQNKKIFDQTSLFDIRSYEELPLGPKIQLSDLYSAIGGLLYTNSGPGYPGLYYKLEKPLSRLFTLDERGLTADPSQVDPTVAGTAAATVQDEDTSYYIKDITVYNSFYQDLDKNLQTRIANERNVVFPQQVSSIIDTVRQAGNREALYFLRTGGIFESTIPGLTVETVIDQSTTLKTNTTTLATSKSTLATTLDQFNKASIEISSKIQQLQDELTNLDNLAASKAVSRDGITQQINAIPCFAAQPDLGGCTELQAQLGSDPLGANMIANGASSTYPDLTTMCYWKEFAKCATITGLLPLPGDNLTNPFKLRYWPVGLIIPTPVKLIHIPLPHIWFPLFVASSPVGTIVILIAQCGIIPSPFIFFISPTGSKSFVFSLKGPQNAIGYDVTGDLSVSSDGRSGPTFKSSIRLPNPFSLIPKAFDPNFPHVATDLSSPIKADLDVIPNLLDQSDRVEQYLGEIKNKIIKQIDSIGDLKLTNIIRARIGANGNLNRYSLEEKYSLVEKDLIDAVGQLNLGKISVPKNKGKLMIKQPAILDVASTFQNFASTGEKLQDSANFSIKHILSGFISEIDGNGITLPKTVISKDPTKILQNLRDKLIFFNESVFKLASGQVDRALKDDDLIYNSQSTLRDAQGSLESSRQQYLKLLSSTASVILSGASIQLFNPFKKCCESTKTQLPTVIDPMVALVLATSKNLILSIINSLGQAELKILTDVTNVGLGEIKSFYNSIVLGKFPDMRLPNTIDIFNYSTLMGFVSPVLGLISIPQVPTLLPLLPTSISIDLDGLAKKSIKTLLSNHTLLQNFAGIDFVSNFNQIDSTELKGILKQIVDQSINDIESALTPIVGPLQFLLSSNGASKTILEAAFPIMNIKAEAKAVIRSLMKNSKSIEYIDTAALQKVVVGELITASSVFSHGASYIPVLILTALGQVKVARDLHPLYNHDDLPSWERLTVKNPLFVLFLDEFCSNAADCTGVILGRTWP